MATLDITGLGYSHDELVVDTFDDLYPDGDNKIYKMATSVLVLDEKKTYVKTGDVEDQSKDTGWVVFG